MDDRLRLADSWRQHYRYLMATLDDLTTQARYANEQERRLRADVEREQEVRELERAADADLVRRPRRKVRVT